MSIVIIRDHLNPEFHCHDHVYKIMKLRNLSVSATLVLLRRFF